MLSMSTTYTITAFSAVAIKQGEQHATALAGGCIRNFTCVMRLPQEGNSGMSSQCLLEEPEGHAHC